MAKKKKSTEEPVLKMVHTKEEALEANMKEILAEIPVDREREEHLKEIGEKIYSYKKADDKGMFRNRTFKRKDITKEDTLHFTGTIMEAYNAAPVDSKVHFMFIAVPKFLEYLKRMDPEMYVLFMHGLQPQKEVN